ncbi:MAG: ABC transporter permease [Nanoarchaeota archaeon]
MGFGVYPVFKRNFRVMLNSKLSFLILIFGPLFLMLITGAALQNTDLRDIEASVFAHKEGSTDLLKDDWYVESFIQNLHDNSFIVREGDSLEACKREVLNSKAHVCIELVKKQSPDVVGDYVGRNINYETKAHVDFSKSRTVWGVINTVQAVSERHSKTLIEGAFLEFRDRISEPMNSLRRNYRSIDVAIGRLDDINDLLDDAEAELHLIEDDLDAVVSSFDILDSKIGTVISYVGAIPDLDPSIQTLLIDLRDHTDVTRDRIDSLENRLSSKNLFDDLSNSQSKVASARNGLVNVKNDVGDVLEEWERIEQTDFENIAPMSFTYQSVSGSEGGKTGGNLEFLDYLFPSFLMFFIIFVSLVFSTVTIFRERSSNAHIRNVTSRTGGVAFTVGNFLSILFILILQILIILFVSMFFLRVSILSNILAIGLFSLVGISLFILIGIAVGYIFDSQEGAVIAAVSVSLLFLIFLPAITPTETLPAIISDIVSFMPFVVIESKLRLASIFGIFPGLSVFESISLVLSFLVGVVVVTLFYRMNKHKET